MEYGSVEVILDYAYVIMTEKVLFQFWIHLQ